MDGVDEAGYVAVARGFRLVQLVFDVVVDVVLGVLQREVFQFGLQLVEAELVCQRGIEVGRFVGHAEAGVVVRGVFYLAHDVDTVGNHDEDDAHVFGKGEEELAEVLRLDAGALLVEFLHADESADDACHVFAELAADFFGGVGAGAHGVVQHDAQDGGPAHAYLFGHDDGRLHVFDKGVQSEDVARCGIDLPGVSQSLAEASAVVLQQCVAREAEQFAVEGEELFLLIVPEEVICFHNRRFCRHKDSDLI